MAADGRKGTQIDDNTLLEMKLVTDGERKILRDLPRNLLLFFDAVL
jgi:hypothetical protein